MKRISDLEIKYVLDALKGEFRSSVNGKYNKLIEAEFAKRFNMPYGIGHVNGTATMHSALVAAGLKPGDKVIVPPLTMSSTSLCVLQGGMVPVYADVNRHTWQIDVQSIEQVCDEKVKAIICVSLYGGCPDYDEIISFAKKRNIVLIEDNAETFLGKYKGKIVGSIGDFSSFSFQASKHMTSGEGGILLVRDVNHALNARRFSSLGYAGISADKGKITKKDIQSPHYNRHVSLGYNYRMSELQAACALGQLERLEELVEIRNKITSQFLEILSRSSLFEPMGLHEGVEAAYWGTSVRLKDDVSLDMWEKVYNSFYKNGGSGFYAAWKLSYMEPYFQNEVQYMEGVTQEYKDGLCPNAEFLQKRIMSFPNNQFDPEELNREIAALEKTIGELDD